MYGKFHSFFSHLLASLVSTELRPVILQQYFCFTKIFHRLKLKLVWFIVQTFRYIFSWYVSLHFCYVCAVFIFKNYLYTRTGTFLTRVLVAVLNQSKITFEKPQCDKMLVQWFFFLLHST